MSEEEDTGVYTSEELIDLQHSRTNRKMIITGLLQDGLPTNTREIELAMMALKDQEDIAVKSSRLRISKKSESETSSNAALLSGLLLSLGNKPPEYLEEVKEPLKIIEMPGVIDALSSDIDLVPLDIHITPKDIEGLDVLDDD